MDDSDQEIAEESEKRQHVPGGAERHFAPDNQMAR